MKISLNDVAPVVPWDLTIEIDGVDYAIRPWELRDTQLLSKMSSMPLEEGYAWVESLFVGTPPAVREWDEDRATRFIGIVLGWKNSISEKKATAVSAMVRRMAMAR